MLPVARLCLLAAVRGVPPVEGDINIFTQVGFVVLVGLTNKNASTLRGVGHETGRNDVGAT